MGRGIMGRGNARSTQVSVSHPVRVLRILRYMDRTNGPEYGRNATGVIYRDELDLSLSLYMVNFQHRAVKDTGYSIHIPRRSESYPANYPDVRASSHQSSYI